MTDAIKSPAEGTQEIGTPDSDPTVSITFDIFETEQGGKCWVNVKRNTDQTRVPADLLMLLKGLASVDASMHTQAVLACKGSGMHIASPEA